MPPFTDMAVPQDLDKQLKLVFDIFDEGKRGFISSDHFVTLAQQHFTDGTYTKKEHISDILHHLDPMKTGRISFDQFAQGVKQIIDKTEGTNQPNIESSGSNYQSNSISEDLGIGIGDDDTNSCGTYETSEGTFNEYDEVNDDSVMTDATDEDAIPNYLTAGTDDTDSALTPSPTSSTMNSYTSTIRKRPKNDYPLIITGKSSTSDEEERYEDFGEGDDMDDSDTDIPDYLSDSNRQTPTTPTQNLSMSFDNRKTITQKRDVWGRVRQLSCPVRRLTTKEIASHLYKNSSSATNSRRGSLEDIYGECAASDSDVTDLNDKVRKLESQVDSLQEDKASKHDTHYKLSNENAFLLEKTRFYEEQLSDAQTHNQETLERERRKHREAMVRLEEEARIESELLTQRVTQLEDETSKLKIDHSNFRTEVDRLKGENKRLSIDLLDRDEEVRKVSHEYKRFQDQWKNERRMMREEIESNATLVVEMSKELEDLRRYKAEHERIGRFRMLDLPSRCAELESEVKSLRQENSALKETNEELNAQVIHSGLQLGRSLLEIGPCKSDSFAAEIEAASKDEIMKALKEQESLNRDLKEYIDCILVRIIENNPSLLERK
ncbi:rab11 family-interacting protein 4B-like isoform X2 [Glandiceps talaboti]